MILNLLPAVNVGFDTVPSMAPYSFGLLIYLCTDPELAVCEESLGAPTYMEHDVPHTSVACPKSEPVAVIDAGGTSVPANTKLLVSTSMISPN